MLKITDKIHIPWSEIQFKSMRSSGPGGQHVNKVSTAIQLIFDVGKSSLPDNVKERIEQGGGRYLTNQGEILIKVDQFRKQKQNHNEACRRLREYILPFTREPKKRLPTKPTRASKQKRLKKKRQRSDVKRLRKKPGFDYSD